MVRLQHQERRQNTPEDLWEMKIVITMPAYNEEDTVGTMTDNIKKVMAGLDYGYEVLVVDDGSADGTASIAKKHGATVYSNPYNLGLANTFRVEIEKALEHQASIIVHIDADGQYKAVEIPKLIKPILEKHYDLVLGSRFAGQIEEMPLIKRIGNKVFSRVISRITKIRITDSQTGFRAFTKRVAEQIKVVSTHTYTQEQIIKAVRANFRLKEVPVCFVKRRSGKSRLISNPFEYAVKAWLNLFRIYRDYSPLSFFGSIGLSLIVIALLLALYSIVVQGEILDITVIVLLLGGIQIILFGFLAEMIKK